MLQQCDRCRAPFDPESSTSALRYTYCGTLCEQGALGFSIIGFIRSDIRPRVRSLEEIYPAEWLDEVLAGLPGEGEPVAAGAESEAGAPFGFHSDWKLYGPLH